MNVDGYTIELKSWFGDYEDCVVSFNVTKPDGKTIIEQRMGHATKGVFRTSIYGIKIKVNLETKQIF